MTIAVALQEKLRLQRQREEEEVEEDGSASDDFVVDDDEGDWRDALKSITGYDPSRSVTDYSDLLPQCWIWIGCLELPACNSPHDRSATSKLRFRYFCRQSPTSSSYLPYNPVVVLLLSKYSRDLGVPAQSHPVGQGSSQHRFGDAEL